MEVALLANMRIDVGFDKGSSMNGINFKLVCKCCEKNVFKDLDDDDDDDDDEGFESLLATLKNAMMSLPMLCYLCRLKSVVIFGTKMAIQ